MKWFNGQKGYGFIQPDDGGEDVFVHISVVQRAGMSSLNEGQKVVFEVVPDRKTGKRRVGRAARALSSPCACSARLGQEWVILRPNRMLSRCAPIGLVLLHQLTFCTLGPASKAGVRHTGSHPGAVDSHHPSPASQHVSSGSSGARRSDRTLAMCERAIAALRRSSAAASRPPTQGMIPAGLTY